MADKDSPYRPLKATPGHYGSNEPVDGGSEVYPDDNMAEDTDKRKSFKSLLSEFAETTSMPGIVRVKTSKSSLLKLFWIAGLLFAFIACTGHMYKVTKLYLSYPKQTGIQLDFTALLFPAVTICNTNAVRLSKMQNLSDNFVNFAKTVNPDALVKNKIQNDSVTAAEFDNKHDSGSALDSLTDSSPSRAKRAAERGERKKRKRKKHNKTGKHKPKKRHKTKMCRFRPRRGKRPQRIPCWKKRKMMKRLRRKKAFLKQLENVNTSSFQTLVENDPQQEKDDAIGPPEASSLIMSQYKLLYSKLDAQARTEAGHQVDDLVVSCSFRGRDCIGQFTASQSLDYGNCYTIQSDEFMVDFNGPEEGLTLVLFMETHEYIKGINNGYGARIVIHEVNTTGFPTEEGFFVSSETETNIGLRHISLGIIDTLQKLIKWSICNSMFYGLYVGQYGEPASVHIIRLNKPYGECADGAEFLKKYGLRYTRQTCQRFCEVQIMLERCNCYSRRKEEDFIRINQSSPQNFTACSSEKELNCSFAVEEELRNHKSTSCPKCLNACEESVYSRSASFRTWPSNEYMEMLVMGLCQKYGEESTFCKDAKNKTTDSRSLGHNFLKMNIYFEDLNYERIEENPSYELEQYLSDLGGAIGLWIGLSVISLLEIGELVYGAVSIVWKKII